MCLQLRRVLQPGDILRSVLKDMSETCRRVTGCGLAIGCGIVTLAGKGAQGLRPTQMPVI